MNHGIGGPADGGIDADGILKRLSREYFRQHNILVDKFHNAPSRVPGDDVSACIDSRIRGIARQANTERLDHAGHRRRGSHGHAMAV